MSETIEKGNTKNERATLHVKDEAKDFIMVGATGVPLRSFSVQRSANKDKPLPNNSCIFRLHFYRSIVDIGEREKELIERNIIDRERRDILGVEETYLIEKRNLILTRFNCRAFIF